MPLTTFAADASSRHSKPLLMGEIWNRWAQFSATVPCYRNWPGSGEDYFRFSSDGSCCGFDALTGSGFQEPAFSGAAGFTPKSHTNRFISLGSSISTSAYSPDARSALGVTFTQPPETGCTLEGTKFSCWLTLP